MEVLHLNYVLTKSTYGVLHYAIAKLVLYACMSYKSVWHLPPILLILIVWTWMDAGFAEQNFSRPASGYSPASFTEGAASQAINPAVNVCAIPSVAVLDVPKSDP